MSALKTCTARIGRNSGNVRGGEICGRLATYGDRCGYHNPAHRHGVGQRTGQRLRALRASRERVLEAQSRLLSEIAKARVSEFSHPDLRRAVEEYREALGLTVKD